MITLSLDGGDGGGLDLLGLLLLGVLHNILNLWCVSHLVSLN